MEGLIVLLTVIHLWRELVCIYIDWLYIRICMYCSLQVYVSTQTSEWVLDNDPHVIV